MAPNRRERDKTPSTSDPYHIPSTINKNEQQNDIQQHPENEEIAAKSSNKLPFSSEKSTTPSHQQPFNPDNFVNQIFLPTLESCLNQLINPMHRRFARRCLIHRLQQQEEADEIAHEQSSIITTTTATHHQQATVFVGTKRQRSSSMPFIRNLGVNKQSSSSDDAIAAEAINATLGKRSRNISSDDESPAATRRCRSAPPDFSFTRQPQPIFNAHSIFQEEGTQQIPIEVVSSSSGEEEEGISPPPSPPQSNLFTTPELNSFHGTSTPQDEEGATQQPTHYERNEEEEEEPYVPRVLNFHQLLAEQRQEEIERRLGIRAADADTEDVPQAHNSNHPYTLSHPQRQQQQIIDLVDNDNNKENIDPLLQHAHPYY